MDDAALPLPVPAPVSVLVLEPDPWRFRGIVAVLHEDAGLDVIGEENFAHILELDRTQQEIDPHVILVADRIIIDYGISVVPKLIDVFSSAEVLIHGEHDTVEVSTRVMAAGASGFFDLAAPPEFLREAVTAVAQGRMWAPVAAISALAQQMNDSSRPASGPEMPALAEGDLLMLRYLQQGWSNKEIAEQLHIAEVTVKARFEHLHRALDARTRQQLLTAALKLGLVVS